MKRFFGTVLCIFIASGFCAGQENRNNENIQIIGGKEFRFGRTLVDEKLEGKFAFSDNLPKGSKPNVKNLFNQAFQDEVTIIGRIADNDARVPKDVILVISPSAARNLGFVYHTGASGNFDYYVLVEVIKTTDDQPSLAPITLRIDEESTEPPAMFEIEEIPQEIVFANEPVVQDLRPGKPINIIIQNYISGSSKASQNNMPIGETGKDEPPDFQSDDRYAAWLAFYAMEMLESKKSEDLHNSDGFSAADQISGIKGHTVQVGIYSSENVSQRVSKILETAGFKVRVENIESNGILLNKVSIVDIPEKDLYAIWQILEFMHLN
ncbi:MAG: hypothetical protein FWH41_01825 [Treponema sp.]|nr:hypothetical protein [Treponema sp.]